MTLKVLFIPLILPSSLFSATLYTGSPNNIFDTGNWDAGLPAIGNQGTISTDSAWPSNNDLNGWDLLLTGGTLTDASTSFSTNEIYGGTKFNIQGGTWQRGGVVRMHGGAEVTVGSGAATIGGIAAISAATGGGQDGGFSLNVSGGTMTMNNVINFNNQANLSTINVSGGSLIMGYVASDARTIDESNSLFNLTGGALSSYSLNMSAADNNIVVTLSDGQFIVGAGGYNPNSTDGITDERNVNFTPGGSATWQLEGADQALFEGLYTNGTLLAGSDNSAPFDSTFQVSGDTISLLAVPEPSSALLSLVGLAAFVRRKRS